MVEFDKDRRPKGDSQADLGMMAQYPFLGYFFLVLSALSGNNLSFSIS